MRRIFLVILPAFILFACSAGKKKAYDFNQQLVAISETLRIKGTNIANALSIAAGTKDFSKVDSGNADLIKFIDQKTADLKSMENVAGSEELKTAMVDFMDYERELVSIYFVPFGKMNKDTPSEEVHTAVERMMEKVKEEEVYLRRLQDAQQDYATKNGFTIDSKKKTTTD
jgi:hypothetical protein